MSSSIVSRCILHALLPKAKGSSCTVRVHCDLTSEVDVDGVCTWNRAMDGLLSPLSPICTLVLPTSDVAGLKPLVPIRVNPGRIKTLAYVLGAKVAFGMLRHLGTLSWRSYLGVAGLSYVLSCQCCFSLST